MDWRQAVPNRMVAVRCSVCGCEATARAVGDDRVRYHLESGAMIRLPGAGMTEELVEKLHRMFLRCECCQEDHEEEYGCR
jgi:hypothetical protein